MNCVNSHTQTTVERLTLEAKLSSSPLSYTTALTGSNSRVPFNGGVMRLLVGPTDSVDEAVKNGDAGPVTCDGHVGAP